MRNNTWCSGMITRFSYNYFHCYLVKEVYQNNFSHRQRFLYKPYPPIRVWSGHAKLTSCFQTVLSWLTIDMTNLSSDFRRLFLCRTKEPLSLWVEVSMGISLSEKRQLWQFHMIYAKPLPQQMVNYRQLFPLTQGSVGFVWKHNEFHYKNACEMVLSKPQYINPLRAKFFRGNLNIQYIPRNMHTVLLCFALLWLCNRS